MPRSCDRIISILRSIDWFLLSGTDTPSESSSSEEELRSSRSRSQRKRLNAGISLEFVVNSLCCSLEFNFGEGHSDDVLGQDFSSIADHSPLTTRADDVSAVPMQVKRITALRVEDDSPKTPTTDLAGKSLRGFPILLVRALPSNFTALIYATGDSYKRTGRKISSEKGHCPPVYFRR